MTKPINPLKQNRIFPKFTLSTKIVGFFTASIIIIGFLQAFEVIDLHSMFFPSLEQSGVYTIEKEAIIGVPYEYDFSWMKSSDCSEPCHFETTAMEGFVPLGLQLWPDGILKGTPTGKSSSFEVCVIDATGKKSPCKKFNQNVSSKASVKTLTDVWSGTYSYTYNLTSQGKVPFTGKFSLRFSRNGDNIKGSYTQYSGEEGTTENIIGTIVGTQIKFNDDWCPTTNVQSSTCFRFTGTISGNSLNLISERCSFNAFCSSRYSTSSQSPAIKGTVTLTR